MDEGKSNMSQDDEILIEDKVESVERKQQTPVRQKFWRLRGEDGAPNYIWLAGVVIALLALIWGMWFVLGEIKLANSKMTKINNFWRYSSGMSETSENSIYAMLYSAIQINLPEGEKPPHRGAKIREGSYSQEKVEDSDDENNVWHSDFIVDVPKLRQSYEISVDWPLDGMTTFNNYYPEVYCLSGDKVIYEDFDCKELPERFPGLKTGPSAYLPYTAYDNDGNVKYLIRLIDGYLMINGQTCGDAAMAKKYEEEAQQWLKDETEIEIDKYKIRYVDTCDNSW